MLSRKTILIAIAVIILLLPLIMWSVWFFTPSKKLVTAIVDKTAMTEKGEEHSSLVWVLNHERFTKTSSLGYDVSRDYFGFFPLQKEQFKLKGLERFSGDQLDQLSRDADVAYYADTYGVYANEWFTNKTGSAHSGIIYGGMSQQDIDFLKKMKERKKLIITEFNSIGSPTSNDIRTQFERLFGLKWSGWMGRFFTSLDTNVNRELPQWLLNSYKKTHEGKWPFTRSGVAFVSNADKVVILEDGKHLNDPLPYIKPSTVGQQVLALPENTKYSSWFDIVEVDSTINKVVAEYKIDFNKEGVQELIRNGIPSLIPAITMHHDLNNYNFYYFSGNFCDNPISITSSYFKGISLFKHFFYNEKDLLERKGFFWNFYKPMVTAILNDYYKKKLH